ncbi:growth factor receptor-bound protein 2a isoform X3 [Takifugu flavidus]|uniref:growth factor receptor-bound protein 2a isoform X3 n=1 Tax=Takifugu flavidus TaxID=433684 RepID=UPI00254424FE|nr:growth factor receptor-bound protein 2a isoform X3 [Takifugu flavidus]
MEANALHDFTATSEDELSFEKGSIVKVRCSHILKKGPHWHRAEQEGREGLVPNNYVKMLPAPFKNGVQHFKVLRDGAGKYFLWVVKFNSLNLLVNYHQKSSISRTEKIFLCLPDMCTAVFDFDGKEANELSFKAGDCIVVLEKSHADWWKGSCNGKVGDFPRTYVKSTEY